MKLRFLIFTLLSLFIFSACSDMQSPTENAQETNEETLTNDQLEEDAEFFVEYKHDLLLSGRMAELALTKSKDDRIKKFAKTVVDDVNILSDKIEKVTATYGIALPRELSEDAKETLEDFQEMSAAEFDEAYLEWFSEYNEDFMEEAKEVIAETKKTNSLMEVANAISAQAYAHNAIIDEIQGDS